MTAHTCSSITCKNPACVRRRIESLLAERFHGPFYTKERAIELVAIEWYSDRARILELMAENEKLQEALKRVSNYVERLEATEYLFLGRMSGTKWHEFETKELEDK